MEALRAEEAKAEQDRRLGEHPQSVGDAVNGLMAAFPGSTVLEDWQQIGHDSWVDRTTGLIQSEPPAGVVPLISG